MSSDTARRHENTLSKPPASVSISEHYMTVDEYCLDIRIADPYFRNAVVSDETGRQLFTIEAKAPFMSWSMRRTLKDASGHAVWDLRHRHQKIREWVVEAQGKDLCILNEQTRGHPKLTAVEAKVLNNSSDAGREVIRMRSLDLAGNRTVFEADSVAFAELLLVENNNVSFPKMHNLVRTAWTLRLAGGVDMAFALALTFCRAEIAHAWRR